MSEVKGVVPPTTPDRAIVPVPAVKLKVVAPLIVLVKLIFAPPPVTVLKMGVPLIVTGPVIVTTPLLVVTFPPTLIAAAV